MPFRPPALILALLLFATYEDASAAATTKRVHSDAAAIDFIVSCNDRPIKTDYIAQTASGVALTSSYAVARGADKGLIRLMNEGGRRTKQYRVPRSLIRALVSVKYDMTLLDRADLLFTAKNLILVHTSTANGGIFTNSDVYQLPYGADRGVDKTSLQDDEDLTRMLELGLASYEAAKGECRR